MSFYSPMQAGPDWGGGIQDLIQQFLMFQLIQQMYPDEKKGKKGEKETLRGMPKIGEMFLGETPLPPQQEMPFGGQLPMGQMGQPPMGQQPGIDIQQIMQMLGGIPGVMR